MPSIAKEIEIKIIKAVPIKKAAFISKRPNTSVIPVPNHADFLSSSVSLLNQCSNSRRAVKISRPPTLGSIGPDGQIGAIRESIAKKIAIPTKTIF